jgi:hypothetical protein
MFSWIAFWVVFFAVRCKNNKIRIKKDRKKESFLRSISGRRNSPLFIGAVGEGCFRAVIGCPVPLGVSGFCRAGYEKAPAAAGAFG